MKRDELRDLYFRIRRFTESLCEPLEERIHLGPAGASPACRVGEPALDVEDHRLVADDFERLGELTLVVS